MNETVEQDIDTIDPLHPNILRAWRGTLIERKPMVRTLIQFESMSHATSWARTCEVENRVTVWDPDRRARQNFAAPVTVRLHPAGE